MRHDSLVFTLAGIPFGFVGYIRAHWGVAPRPARPAAPDAAGFVAGPASSPGLAPIHPDDRPLPGLRERINGLGDSGGGAGR